MIFGFKNNKRSIKKFQYNSKIILDTRKIQKFHKVINRLQNFASYVLSNDFNSEVSLVERLNSEGTFAERALWVLKNDLEQILNRKI